MQRYKIQPLGLMILFVILQPALARSYGPTQGEEIQVDQLNATVLKLCARGDFKAALPIAQRVLELRSAAPERPTPKVVEALYNLGAVYEGLGNSKEALSLFKRALETNQVIHPDDPYSARILDRVGHLYYSLNDNSSAIDSYGRSLALKERVLGDLHPETVRSVLNLAVMYERVGNAAKAESFLERFFQLRDVMSAQDRAKTELEVEQLACDLRALKRTEDAKKIEVKLGIIEVMAKAGEPNGTENADSLNGRAIRLPAPLYPQAARMTRTQGIVAVRVIISEEGSVIVASALDGHPFFQTAAREAALKATFTPTIRNGKPVKVAGRIIYHFVSQ